MVHHTAEAWQLRAAQAVASGAAVLLLALLAGGCGGSGDNRPPAGSGPVLGAPVRLADCDEWNAGSADQRLGTIAVIQNYLGGPVSGTANSGPTLDTQQAYQLFENACEQPFAASFRLYKLYARAASFAPE